MTRELWRHTGAKVSTVTVRKVLREAGIDRLKPIRGVGERADAASAGKCAQVIAQTHGISVEVVRHPGNRSTGTRQDAQQPLWPEILFAKGFVVQAKRWVLERTHAWNERARRLIAHHDRSNWAPVAWVWPAEAPILASRLAL